MLVATLIVYFSGEFINVNSKVNLRQMNNEGVIGAF